MLIAKYKTQYSSLKHQIMTAVKEFIFLSLQARMWKWRRHRRWFLCRWYVIVIELNETKLSVSDNNFTNKSSIFKSFFSFCNLGFGVCCILILTNGGSTSLNQSYIVQAASTSLGVGSREYTICPCSSDICRIKFDFTVCYFIIDSRRQ